MRDVVMRRAFEALSATEEQGTFVFFVAVSIVVAVATYWYMRSKMR